MSFWEYFENFENQWDMLYFMGKKIKGFKAQDSKNG
jgi:hypothetical protein